MSAGGGEGVGGERSGESGSEARTKRLKSLTLLIEEFAVLKFYGK